MESPCVGLCIYDAQKDRCRGCARSLAEIEAWPSLDEPAREKLMAELKARQTGLKPD